MRAADLGIVVPTAMSQVGGMVTRRPIYRWKSFWFGWLVLVFLAWAWERSARQWDDLSFGIGGTGAGVFFQNYRGVAVVGFSGKGWLLPGVRQASTPIEDKVRFNLTVGGALKDGLLAFRCAHWILILLFFFAWLGWLGWRWRSSGKPGFEGRR
jgi:hypothetical protein